MIPITFNFYIDWDNDGDWDQAYEDISKYVKDANWSVGMTQPYQLVSDESRLTMTLWNSDKRFSPEYSSSPYYGSLTPLRLVRIASPERGSLTSQIMYTGWIDTIDPEGGDGKTAVITAVSMKQFLQDEEVSLPLMTDVSSDEAMLEIFSRAALPQVPKSSPTITAGIWYLGLENWSELGETTRLNLPPLISGLGVETFPYVGDQWDSNFFDKGTKSEEWEAKFRVWNAIEDICRAERGKLYFDRNGMATFLTRRVIDAWTTGAFSGSAYTDIFIQPPDYTFGELRASKVRVMAYPRTLGPAGAVLWTLDEALTLNSGQERTIRVDYTDADTSREIAGANAQISTFTHTGNVDYVVEFTARGASITVSNRDAVDNTVSAIIITGQALTVDNRFEAMAEDEDAGALYGRIDYTIDSKVMADPEFAQLVADYELSRRKTPTGIIKSVTILADSDSRASLLLPSRLFSPVQITDTQLAHTGVYMRIGEGHRWGLHEGYRVTWYLEPIDTTVFWHIGTAGQSELGQTTTLGL